MSSLEAVRLPVVDFSNLDLSKAGTDQWLAVRAQVIPALKSYGCFEAVYNKITPELLDAVFGKTVEEMFNLPFEAKVKNISAKKYGGYTYNIPGMDYESLVVEEPTERECVERFSALMWGTKGNPAFCDTICSYAKHFSELDQMIRRMMLESLGVESYFGAHIESTKGGLRISKYGGSQTDQQATVIGMGGHKDPMMSGIVCQHEWRDWRF